MITQHSATHRYGNFICLLCAGKLRRGLGPNIFHPIISSCDSKFPPFEGTRSARHCTTHCQVPPLRSRNLLFFRDILLRWRMATPEICMEQEDGRWNEAAGAYMGDGKHIHTFSLWSKHDRRRCKLASLVFIFCAESFYRCQSRESFRLWNGRTAQTTDGLPILVPLGRS